MSSFSFLSVEQVNLRKTVIQSTAGLQCQTAKQIKIFQAISLEKSTLPSWCIGNISLYAILLSWKRIYQAPMATAAIKYQHDISYNSPMLLIILCLIILFI